MFKNLKKKIEQGVAQSKAAVSGLSTTKGDDSSERLNAADTLGKPVAESTPQKAAERDSLNAQDVDRSSLSGSRQNLASHVPTGQLVDIPLFEGGDSTHYETASDISSVRGDETPKGRRSRTASISSMTSESSFFPSVNFSHNYYLPSDAESEMEETSVNLSSVSKEDLYAFVKRFERRAFKYKSKFMELVTAYKETMQEREKLKMTMTQCQDRAFRRMAELREQIQLDQVAKRDLEENFRLHLDEKDEYMKVLQMQVRLLKEGKEIPDELQVKLSNHQAKAEAPPLTASGDSKASISTNEEIELLKSKVKRQDGLLQKCKETITNYKDRLSHLSAEKQELAAKLSQISTKGEDNANEGPTAYRAQIEEAKKVIQQLESDKEIAVALVKQQIHEEMTKKDKELEQCQEQHQILLADNGQLKLQVDKLTQEVENLRRTNQEQLEKARAIMRQLKEDRQQALDQAEAAQTRAEASIQQAELTMEEEKEKMIQDLKRGKNEALAVLQQEAERHLQEKLKEVIEERDSLWNTKLAEMEDAHKAVLSVKNSDIEKAESLIQELSHKLTDREERNLAEERATDNEQDRTFCDQIQALTLERQELSNKLAQLQSDHEKQISLLEENLRRREAELESLISELKVDHEARLLDQQNMLQLQSSQELESVKQMHSQELQRIQQEHSHHIQDLTSPSDSSLLAEMEGLRQQVQELQAKLASAYQELATVSDEFSTRNQEYVRQVEELYAAINGKGEDNERLKQELGTAQAELEDKQKKLEEVMRSLADLQHEISTLRNEKEATEEELRIQQKEVCQLREQVQTNQLLTAQREAAEGQVAVLEASIQDLQNQNTILVELVSSTKEELESLQSHHRALQIEKEHLQQEVVKLCQEKQDSQLDHIQLLGSLKEELKLASEEREKLVKQVTDSQLRVQELEAGLQEVSLADSSRDKLVTEMEGQLLQVKEKNKEAELCISALEQDKLVLSQKVGALEEEVANLRTDSEEYQQKVQAIHEEQVRQSICEQESLQQSLREMISQVDYLGDEVNRLQEELVIKNEKIVSLTTLADTRALEVETQEATIKSLTESLQEKMHEIDISNAALSQHLETLNLVKSESSLETQGLMEKIDNLVVSLNKKQLECEEVIKTSEVEKNALIQSYEEKLQQIKVELQNTAVHLEQEFREKEKQISEQLLTLTQDYENKLLDKDKEMEIHVQNLSLERDRSIENLKKQYEQEKDEELRSQEQKYLAIIHETETDWQGRCQLLKDELIQRCTSLESLQQKQLLDVLAEQENLKQELDTARSSLESFQEENENRNKQMQAMVDSHRQEVAELQELLASRELRVQELAQSLESIQAQLVIEQQHSSSLTTNIKDLTEKLEQRDRTLESLTTNLSSAETYLTQQAQEISQLQSQNQVLFAQLRDVQEKYQEEISSGYNLTAQIHALTESIRSRDVELTTMSNQLLSEQELSQNLLNQKDHLVQELEAQNNNFFKQINDLTEKQSTEMQETSQLLNEAQHRLHHQQIVYASLAAMFGLPEVSSDTVTDEGSFKEHIEKFLNWNNAQVSNLQASMEGREHHILDLEKELKSLNQQNEQMRKELLSWHALETDLRNEHASSVAQLSTQNTEQQLEIEKLQAHLVEANMRLQEAVEDYEAKFKEDKLKQEGLTAVLNEQISILRQQITETQNKADLSSQDFHESLQQKLREGEDKLLAQLQSHQEEVETLKQGWEQGTKDLKQKYITKLKEIQNQAKNNTEDLVRSLNEEKTARAEVDKELAQAKAAVEQLENTCEASRQTMASLEQKIVELLDLINGKDIEIGQLKVDLESREQNSHEQLQESLMSSQLISQKYTQSESLLKARESDIQDLEKKLEHALSLLEQKQENFTQLSRRARELEESVLQGKEEHVKELQEKDRKVHELQAAVEDSQTQLSAAQDKLLALEDNLKLSSVDLKNKLLEKDKLESELSHLEVKNQELESQLQEASVLLQNSKQETSLNVLELEARFEEVKLQLQIAKNEAEKQMSDLEQLHAAELKSVSEQISQNYDAKLSDQQQAHAAEIADLSLNIEAQSSAKVAEYKKKAEAYISQVKKQLQDEKAASLHTQQVKIAELEEVISALKNEITDLLVSTEKINKDHKLAVQELQDKLDVEKTSKHSIIEENSQQEQILKEQVNLLQSENNVLLEKLSVIEKADENVKEQISADVEQLKAENVELQHQLKQMGRLKEELEAQKSWQEEALKTMKAEHQAALEEQAQEHTSKLKALLKEMNTQMMQKETEFDAAFREVIEKSERNEQEFTRDHQEDVKELRKEISERDDRMEELHLEYTAKLEEKDQTINELQSQIMQLRSPSGRQPESSQSSIYNGLDFRLQNTAHNSTDFIDAPLQQQVLLATQTEQTKHRLDPADASHLPDRQGKTTHRSYLQDLTDINDPDFSLEIQDLQLHNEDLQAQLSHLSGELNQSKLRERDLLTRIEKLERVAKGLHAEDDTTSLTDGLYSSHVDPAVFREPTEFEYLKNILYEYMMGRETRTLAKVIATVVRFSDEQMRNVLARSDSSLI